MICTFSCNLYCGFMGHLYSGRSSITSTDSSGCPHDRGSYESYYSHISPFTRTNDEHSKIALRTHLRNAYCGYASRMAAQSKHVKMRSKSRHAAHAISRSSHPRVLIEERLQRAPKRVKRGWRLRRAIRARDPHCHSRVLCRDRRVGPHVCREGYGRARAGRARAFIPASCWMTTTTGAAGLVP
jgi:hypothetical protein